MIRKIQVVDDILFLWCRKPNGMNKKNHWSDESLWTVGIRCGGVGEFNGFYWCSLAMKISRDINLLNRIQVIVGNFKIPAKNGSKFPYSSCQNFLFQTIKISFPNCQNFHFPNCQNFPFPNCQNFLSKLSKFPFQTVKNFLSKLSKISFPNCQIFLFQTVKFFTKKRSFFQPIKNIALSTTLGNFHRKKNSFSE